MALMRIYEGRKAMRAPGVAGAGPPRPLGASLWPKFRVSGAAGPAPCSPWPQASAVHCLSAASERGGGLVKPNQSLKPPGRSLRDRHRR
jgi:hypothetical protein